MSPCDAATGSVTAWWPTSTGSEINGVAIAADPLGGWVVAERQYPRKGSGKPYRVRALSLDAQRSPDR